ncbi:MAG TPA: hypothetical protein PK987_00120 [Ferruginibacter sp.]|nr:hypothetical protein [Ferruginibacter sp.]
MNKPGGIKALKIVHKVMLMGQIVFAAVSIYLVYAGIINAYLTELDKKLQVIVLIIAATGIYAGRYYFKKKVFQIQNSLADAKQKFDAYRAASLLQWSLIEIPAIVSIICFFLTANYAFIALAFFLIAIFAMQAPSKSKIVQQLQIEEAELETL